MNAYRFETSLTFDQARAMMNEINAPAHKHLVAHLTWLEGNQAGQSISFRWDPMAERFGHQLDKEPLEREIVYSLLIGIPVEVALHEIHADGDKR